LNTFLDSTDLPEKAGTAGRASADDDVFLVELIEDGFGDPKNLVAKDGKTLGEVVIRCSHKGPDAYHNKPEVSAKKFHNGYVYTGDLATWDADEYISIVGRKDDMMISAGENIYPQPIEEAICSHPLVADCIVVPVSEMTRGQALCAYIARKSPDLTVRELLKFCLECPTLSAFTTPRYYKFVDELPYTASRQENAVRPSRQSAGRPEKRLVPSELSAARSGANRYCAAPIVFSHRAFRSGSLGSLRVSQSVFNIFSACSFLPLLQ
jgi:long-chain acyl-CoA synthetase